MEKRKGKEKGEVKVSNPEQNLKTKPILTKPPNY